MGRQNVKNTMIDKMLEFVAPHLCSGCGKTGTLLCVNCKNDIINNPFTHCIVCGSAISSGICSSHSLAYKRAWVVGMRRGPLRRLIGGFKFRNMKAAAGYLAELLDERLPELSADTLLVPIPTAPSHIRERGYDHTLLVTQFLAARRGLAIEHQLLMRNETTTQHTASRKDRISQAVFAFRVKGVAHPDTPYVIIDDVFTTGSTIRQASQLLYDAGARRLSVAVIARQPID